MTNYIFIKQALRLRLAESRGPQPRRAEARYSHPLIHAVSAGCCPNNLAAVRRYLRRLAPLVRPPQPPKINFARDRPPAAILTTNTFIMFPPFVTQKVEPKCAAVKRFRGRPCDCAESDAFGTFEAIKRFPILNAPSLRPPISRNRFCRGSGCRVCILRFFRTAQFAAAPLRRTAKAFLPPSANSIKHRDNATPASRTGSSLRKRGVSIREQLRASAGRRLRPAQS